MRVLSIAGKLVGGLGIEGGQEGVKIFKGGVFDYYAAFAFFVFDFDAEAEGALKSDLGFMDVGVLFCFSLLSFFEFAGSGLRMNEVVDVGFGLADGHGKGGDLLGGGDDRLRSGESEQRASVAEGELARFDTMLDDLREAQKPEEVGDGGALLAGAYGHLLLGHVEVGGQTVKGARLLHGVEVGALEVFDDRHLHGLLV